MIDIEALLKPISNQSEAGADIQDTGLYADIREARREDNPRLRPGAKNLKKANWDGEKGVKQLAINTLKTQSKDLWVAAYLTEALFKTEGFQGLQQGLILMRELQGRYWTTLFPQIDSNGDLSLRKAPFRWMNMDKELPLQVRKSPLVKSDDDTAPTFLDYCEGRIAQGGTNKFVSTEPSEHFQTLFRDIGGCREALQSLATTTAEKFGSAEISFGDLEQAFADCQGVVGGILKTRGVNTIVTTAVDHQKTPTNAVERKPVDAAGAVGTGRGPMDRADALRCLREVAEFFRRTEPHSPVGPLVERAVRWGDMSLEQWLQEMIEDDKVRTRLWQELGVRGVQHTDRKG